MSVNVIQTAFSSGELSPSLYARVDLDKYHQGAALLRNFFVDYRGGAKNRAGTKWIGRTKGQNGNVRDVRWAFNSDQTYALEFGNLYMRVKKNGGYVLEPAKVITAASQANPGVITSNAHGFANNDWVYVDLVVGMTQLNKKTFIIANATANTFTLKTTAGVDVNTIPYTAYISGGTAARLFTLVTPYIEADLFGLRFTQAADVMTITSNNYAPRNLTRSAHYAWSLALVVFGSTQARPTAPGITSSQPAGTTEYRYGITAVSVVSGDESEEVIRTGQFKEVFESVNMWNKLTWTAAPGAAYYNIYRAPYGKGEPTVLASSILGLIGTTRGLAFVDKGFTADYSLTPPVPTNPFLTENPLVSTYFQQRKVYANSLNYSQTFWTSKINNFNNFDSSLPARQDDSITATLSSLQVNQIKHMVPMPGGLITFTSGGVWQISGGGVNTPITPDNLIATPQGYNGAGEPPPIPTNFNILYIQEKGSIVRDLSYNFFVNIYSSMDITTLSSHLFIGHTIVDWAFAEEPWKVFWLVREDGKLLSLTYLQENEVVGWAQHDTLGLVRSVCTIAENGQDYLYMIVERYIPALGWVRYSERMESRTCPNGLDDAWFLDCALEYPLVFPAATLFPASGSVASNIIFTASAAVFSAGTVGSYIRYNGGLALVTAFDSTTQIRAQILQAFPMLDDNTPIYAVSGKWSCTAPVTQLTDLDHLEGKSVTLLADGGVIGPKTVVNGTVTLGVAASRIICGLSYKSQLGTLYLDIGDANAEGRRKSIPAVNVRVEATRGIKAGPELTDLQEMKMDPNPIYSLAAPLVTDDVRLVIGSYFNSKGQVFVEQSYPLPANILGIIPEVWIGDS